MARFGNVASWVVVKGTRSYLCSCFFQIILYHACLAVHFRSRHYLGVQKSPLMFYPTSQNVTNVAIEIVPTFNGQWSLLAGLCRWSTSASFYFQQTVTMRSFRSERQDPPISSQAFTQTVTWSSVNCWNSRRFESDINIQMNVICVLWLQLISLVINERAPWLILETFCPRNPSVFRSVGIP